LGYNAKYLGDDRVFNRCHGSEEDKVHVVDKSNKLFWLQEEQILRLFSQRHNLIQTGT